jgi:hypothetical protein
MMIFSNTLSFPITASEQLETDAALIAASISGVPQNRWKIVDGNSTESAYF